MRRLPVGVIVAMAVFAAGGVGAVNLARGVRGQLRTVETNASKSFEARYGGGAVGLDVDHRFTLAALAYMRTASERYVIETGSNVQVSSPLTLRFMITYFSGRLLPARRVDLASANWILCYGCDPGAYPAFETTWNVDAYAILRRRA